MRVNSSSKLLLFFFLASCGDVVPVNDAGAGDTGPQIDAEASALQVTRINPPAGIITTKATIVGTLFGSEGSVTVDGQTAAVVSWADTQIEISIPDVLPGPREVVVISAGMSDAATFTVILPPSLYINNQPSSGNGSLSVMSFSATDQSLTQIGTVIPLANPSHGFSGCGESIALHVGSRRVFATTKTTIAVLEIDGETGGLTLLGETSLSNTDAGLPPSLDGLITNAAGTLLFANARDGIHVVRVNPNGSLNELANSPFELGLFNNIPRLSDDEKFLFVNREDSNFDVWAVATEGALSPNSNSPFDNFQTDSFTTAKRPGVPQIYLSDGNELSVLTYNETTGQPVAVTGSPFLVSGAQDLHHMTFTPNDRLYVAQLNSTGIYIFDLDAAGVPTPNTPPLIVMDGQIESTQCLLTTRSGSNMLALDQLGSKVSVFRFNGDGTMEHVTNSPFTFTAANANATGMVATF